MFYLYSYYYKNKLLNNIYNNNSSKQVNNSYILFLVKYLREVTPYFRKASIISEVGWELQRGFLSGAPPVVKFPQRADTRYLPLQLCHLARNFRYPDPGKLYIITETLIRGQYNQIWAIRFQWW